MKPRLLDPPNDVVYAGCLACWQEAEFGSTVKLHNGLGDNCPACWPDALPDPDGSTYWPPEDA